ESLTGDTRSCDDDGLSDLVRVLRRRWRLLRVRYVDRARYCDGNGGGRQPRAGKFFRDSFSHRTPPPRVDYRIAMATPRCQTRSKLIHDGNARNLCQSRHMRAWWWQ